MKNLMFYVKFAIVLVVIGWIAKAWAVKPVSPPTELTQEAANVQPVHKGFCNYKDQQVLCMVGYDEATETFWLLVFNDEGVLTHVVTNHKNIETLRWVHPMLSV